jgi:hypothetical protein
VNGWRFETPELAAPIIEQTAVTEWRGTAAVGGTVIVEGDVDGVPGSGSGPLLVHSRDWSADTVLFILENAGMGFGPDTLPEHPDSLGDLGKHLGDWLISVFQRSVEGDSGPNQGVWYLTQVPLQALSRIRINYVALADSSDFWFLQPKGGPATQCTRSRVAPFLPKVEEHEGLTLSLNPASHAGVWRNELNLQVPPAVEHVVALGSWEALEAAVQQAASPGITDAVKKHRHQTEPGGTVPAVPWCNFKYFQP